MQPCFVPCVDMKPGWDSRTRVNFEELWGEGDTKQVARALRATRAGSPTKAVLTWADEQGEVHLHFSNSHFIYIHTFAYCITIFNFLVIAR